jgi:mannose-6-phosphate isomerase-like protein (cupin superfamily)
MNTQDRSPKIVQANAGSCFNVMGSMMSYKATTEDTGGAYSLAVEITLPHGGLPLHVHHQEDEVMYILEGEYEIQCGDQVFSATAGTFVFLPKDIPNRYQNFGDTPGKFIHITSPGGCEKLVEYTSLMCASGSTDMQQVKETAKQYGVEFV